MKAIPYTLAALFAAVALTACGGGGGGGDAAPGDPNPPAPAPAPAPVVETTTPPSYSDNDCPKFLDGAKAEAALDLSDTNVAKVNDYLKQVAATHAYQVFVRRPYDFVNWIAMMGGKVDLATVGTAAHETNHMVSTVLRTCGAPDAYKVQFFGDILTTSLEPKDTASIKVVATFLPDSLKTEDRYKIYITDAAAGNDFTVLLDEFAAYVGGADTELQIFTAAMSEPANVGMDSNLGGTVNFMVFIQTYLRAVRNNDPAVYNRIAGDPTTVAAIQAIWTRAEQVLEESLPYTQAASQPRLVISTAYLEQAYSPVLLEELDRLGILHFERDAWVGLYLPE